VKKCDDNYYIILKKMKQCIKSEVNPFSEIMNSPNIKWCIGKCPRSYWDVLGYFRYFFYFYAQSYSGGFNILTNS